jgi:myo-inositol-1-phosphate synthase
MPTYISTEDARRLELKAIERRVTIVGSDMRSSYGASRLSEVLEGSLMDSGLEVTQHIQMNMAAGSTQGEDTSSMAARLTPTFSTWPRSRASTTSTSRRRMS